MSIRLSEAMPGWCINRVLLLDTSPTCNRATHGICARGRVSAHTQHVMIGISMPASHGVTASHRQWII